MALKIVSGRGKPDLRDELERLREREALKTDLIRIAAHGLRNPLNLVMGYAEILTTESSDLTDDQLVFLDGIKTASKRMFRIIETVLSLERLEEFEDGIVNEPIDLAELVQEVIEQAREDAARADIHLKEKLSEMTVQGDRIQLYEALANVVGNAIKYSSDGGDVNISMEKHQGMARVRVEDHGIGIPEEEQARIFEPFFRASGAAEKIIEGVGLGLYLGQRVMARHGGRILLDSRPDEGSIFTLELPLG